MDLNLQEPDHQHDRGDEAQKAGHVQQDLTRIHNHLLFCWTRTGAGGLLHDQEASCAVFVFFLKCNEYASIDQEPDLGNEWLYTRDGRGQSKQDLDRTSPRIS